MVIQALTQLVPDQRGLGLDKDSAKAFPCHIDRIDLPSAIMMVWYDMV